MGRAAPSVPSTHIRRWGPGSQWTGPSLSQKRACGFQHQDGSFPLFLGPLSSRSQAEPPLLDIWESCPLCCFSRLSTKSCSPFLKLGPRCLHFSPSHFGQNHITACLDDQVTLKLVSPLSTPLCTLWLKRDFLKRQFKSYLSLV